MKDKPKVTNVDFRDKKFFEELENNSHPNSKFLKMALLHLSLCHTTICEVKNGELVYNASSPDELALVNYAKYCGYEYQGQNEKNIIKIKNPKNEEKFFEVLQILEFNSTRYFFSKKINQYKN